MSHATGHILVVGAGIGGMRTAMDLAETGHAVTLVEHAPHVGGLLASLDHQFPTNHCGMCRMLPRLDRDQSVQACLRKGLTHERIHIRTDTDIMAIDGDTGNLTVTLRQKSGYVDARRCMGCGACADVCPVDIPDPFNAGLSTRKAIHSPLPHAWPALYQIDGTACTRCGECRTVCPTNAIVLPAGEKSHFRVLVVDDEAIVRESIRDWLREEEGFHVDVADSGPAGLSLLTNAPYHLMLLDIKMPGMDGVDVLRQASTLSPDTQVIMMTAFATVETAVEAMKIGAMDYLIKPFEPDALIPKVMQVYDRVAAMTDQTIQVQAVILNAGTTLYDPSSGKNNLGYQTHPGVVTSLEFERIISNSGPFAGKLVRPKDDRPVQRLAWLQCVGSRDFQSDGDFCSSVCCMISIKEAVLAREKYGPNLDAAIYYMDMRTYDKSFQRYRDAAERDHGIRFVRGRVHTMIIDPKTQDLVIRYADRSGDMQESIVDMAVLAIGQRPARAMPKLADMCHLPLNSWGFAETQPFSLTRTAKPGIFLGGSFTGLKDIRETVILSSAAGLNASRALQSGVTKPVTDALPAPRTRDVSRELPAIRILICTCHQALQIDTDLLSRRLRPCPSLLGIDIVTAICTPEGSEAIGRILNASDFNRLLVAACPQEMHSGIRRDLAQMTGLDRNLIDCVDIHTPIFRKGLTEHPDIHAEMAHILDMGIHRLAGANPLASELTPIHHHALVVGGGVAGMTAALALADHGVPVDLVEKNATLGGNLCWIQETLQGDKIPPFRAELEQKISKHPNITLYTQTTVAGFSGQTGGFVTTLEGPEKKVTTSRHGAVILATGGMETPVQGYGYGQSPAILTQKELEEQIATHALNIGDPGSVVMIQCAGTREEPRNYCSRVCCATSLKQAMMLKSQNPELAVYILYRDMMTYGFTEHLYTRARKAGVVFIAYDPEAKPTVMVDGNDVRVRVMEPVLNRVLEIQADRVILAAGMIPSPNTDICGIFGIKPDPDGFYQEADIKWRPVESTREGVFVCGIGLSPGTISESIATAEAAAQKALALLFRPEILRSRTTARVRHSLCSLCQLCISACPYGARQMESDLNRIVIDPLMCQGCGACAAICPNDAAVMDEWLPQHMFGVIDAALA